MLLLLLLLPLLIDRIGLPPRIEAYKGLGTNAGAIGGVIRDLYASGSEGGVVFLGSSLVEAGIDRNLVAQSLMKQEGRRMPVAVLALNWPGLDLQYFLLRDYLSSHQARLVVWNLPQPHARPFDAPHIQSYHWIRFGEYSDGLEGLSLPYRLSLYGEMVLGAPRQLLARFRPNLTGEEALHVEPAQMFAGYNQGRFVTDNVAMQNVARLVSPGSSLLNVTGPALGPYQMHFAREIVELVRQHGCRLVLIHIPIDAEFGQTRLPELTDWRQALDVNVPMIAIPSAALFAGLNRERFLHFYRDAHLNQNGVQAFTRSILPALDEAYEQANAAR